MISIKEAQEIYSKQLPYKELDLLLELILNKPSLNFITQPNEKIVYSDIKLLEKLIEKRISGKPIAYLLGKKEFYGREFKVSSDTLVPRPESELIIDITKEILLKNTNETYTFLDIGTGSGNIITTLSCEFSDNKNAKNYIAIDISNDALKIANNNFKALSNTNLMIFNSNLLNNIKLIEHLKTSCFESDNLLITANLPYVDISLKEELLKNEESRGLNFEPNIALWSKDGGLWHYKQLIPQIINLQKQIPNTQITAIYEINNNQNSPLKNFIKSTKYKQIDTYKDLSGKNRVIKHIF